MAHHGSLYDLFDQKIERWTQSFSLMDAFARYALTVSRFVCPVTHFIRQIVEKQADEFGIDKKLIEYPFLFPEAPSVSSKSSDENKYRRQAKTKRAVPNFSERRRRA